MSGTPAGGASLRATRRTPLYLRCLGPPSSAGYSISYADGLTVDSQDAIDVGVHEFGVTHREIVVTNTAFSH